MIILCAGGEAACADAGVVLTVTPAREPLVKAAWLRGRDVLVAAIGADSPGKQELEVEVCSTAALAVADSTSQCSERGELQHAVSAGLLGKPGTPPIVEIGEWLARSPRPPRPSGLVVFDSTGVAVQDVMIAQLALAELKRSPSRL